MIESSVLYILKCASCNDFNKIEMRLRPTLETICYIILYYLSRGHFCHNFLAIPRQTLQLKYKQAVLE